MPPIRNIINQYIRNCLPAGQSVAVFLSGGIDSASICYSLSDLNISFTCYTFRLTGVISSDYTRAKKRARILGLPLIDILLPTSPSQIIADMRFIATLGAVTKTDYECVWPFIHAIPRIAESHILLGHGADGHFCISKKGMIHYKDSRIDEFRANLFSNPKYCQRPILEQVASISHKRIYMPYLSPSMVNAFKGLSWNSINRPKQKQSILDEYPELLRMPYQPHTNLQLGDSRIAVLLKDVMLNSGIVPGAKSPVAVYNALRKSV